MPSSTAASQIEDLIGNTPLVRLRRIERDVPGIELYAKAEFFNPGGSVKDRPALNMQGKEELVVRLIRRRFGSVSDSTTAHLDKLSAEQLDELGEALFDFSSPSDLDQWLTRH